MSVCPSLNPIADCTKFIYFLNSPREEWSFPKNTTFSSSKILPLDRPNGVTFPTVYATHVDRLRIKSRVTLKITARNLFSIRARGGPFLLMIWLSWVCCLTRKSISRIAQQYPILNSQLAQDLWSKQDAFEGYQFGRELRCKSEPLGMLEQKTQMEEWQWRSRQM